MRYTLLLLFTSLSFHLISQNDLCTYAGGMGDERFNDVLQLSNGDILIGGQADDLGWLPATVNTINLSPSGLNNNQGQNQYAFLLLVDSTGQQLKKVFSMAQGEADNIRFIKTTSLPGAVTGDIYVSGAIENSDGDGYFIGKLDNNFVNGDPTGFAWVFEVRAKSGDYPREYQPWDVGSDGKVVYAHGDSHDYNWSAIYRLTANGQRDVVPKWRVHWQNAGGEFFGDANTHPNGLSAIKESGIVFKRDANRCELRSTNQSDYDSWSSDGNGGMRKGKWPLDVLYDGPCDPGQSGNSVNGPGYTGYKPPATFTYGPSAIAIDRRTNHMFIGFNAKSVLPSNLPDFEPAVMAMDKDGELLWWSRLYHEVTPMGDTVNSTPDQYVDNIAIDYSQPLASGQVVVGARCHGNNVENLWEGNAIQANPTASGFQNRFTGSSGNIHIGWLGKLGIDNGTLYHSTYVAEFSNGSNFGSAHPDPNLDGFPDPNSGWPDLNTTYLTKNMMKVTAAGHVVVLGTGRRTITTRNAFQKMANPYFGGQSAWNAYARVYKEDLSLPLYSSLMVGQWDTLTQVGGGNVELSGVFKTNNGLLLVGHHDGSGNEIPTAGVPSWGNANYQGESAIFAYLKAINLKDNRDGPASSGSIGLFEPSTSSLQVYPNPSEDGIFRLGGWEGVEDVEVYDMRGQLLKSVPIVEGIVDLSDLPTGSYLLSVDHSGVKERSVVVIR